jgi:hypothetical protein
MCDKMARTMDEDELPAQTTSLTVIDDGDDVIIVACFDATKLVLPLGNDVGPVGATTISQENARNMLKSLL